LLSSLLIALREGVEASLIVGIVLVYLNRSGRAALARYVWAAVALAVAMSGVVAYLLSYWNINEDGFEGVLLLVAAFFVVTMVVWMNHISRKLKKEIEDRVAKLAERPERAAGWGLFLFVFLMVVREGAELALILRAVEFSAQGVNVWIGTLLGLGIAVAVGLFFFKGTLRIPLGRFFAATSIILMIVGFQLALTGVHELSEAQWLASSQREMAIVGPIVRNDVFFFVVILGAVAILVVREWMKLKSADAAKAVSAPNSPATQITDADLRRAEWDRRKQSRWMFAAASVSVLVIVALATDFVYGRAVAAPAPAQILLAQNDSVRVQVSQINDDNLHFFQVRDGNTPIRFFVIRKPGGAWGVVLDACRICGPQGYRQDGQNVICRNCSSAIYIPSIGQAGGCNPVGLQSRADGDSIVVELKELRARQADVPGHQ
jgi:high-affinity iron transporter